MLTTNGLLKPNEVLALVVYSKPPYSCDDLDIGRSYPPAVWTTKELTSLREQETRLYRIYQAKKLPVRKPDLKRSLTLLRRAKRDRPADFKKGITKKKISEFLKNVRGCASLFAYFK